MKKKEVKYVATPTEAPVEEKKKKFSLVKFFIKVVSVAILLAFGIIIILNKEQAIFAILMVTGFAAIISAVIRIFTVILRTNYKRTRILTLIEVVLHCIIGLYIVFAAYNYNQDQTSDFAKFNVTTMYHYLLAAILYTRALVYFWTTILYHEETKKSQFWVHIACMTLGCVIAGMTDFSPEQIAIALAVLALAGAIVIGSETGVGYFKYRKSIAPAKKKKEEVEKKDETNLPGEDKAPMVDPNIINDNNDDRQNDIIS